MISYQFFCLVRFFRALPSQSSPSAVFSVQKCPLWPVLVMEIVNVCDVTVSTDWFEHWLWCCGDSCRVGSGCKETQNSHTLEPAGSEWIRTMEEHTHAPQKFSNNTNCWALEGWSQGGTGICQGGNFVSSFLGDLNLTLDNVWWWKSPTGIKRQNVWTRVWKYSICSILVMFGFFIHFWAVVDAQSVKRTNFWFYVFLQPKNQYGQHGKIGVWLYKWLKSSEMVDIYWSKYIEKM